MGTRLTQTLIEQTRARFPQMGKSQVILWDSEIKGFGARLTAGSTRYILNYVVRGSRVERRMTIADFKEATVAKARELAAVHMLKIRAGEDPLGAIKARKQEATGITLETAYTRWVAAQKDEWSAATVASYGKAFAAILPALGSRQLASISKGLWASTLDEIAERAPSTAALARRAAGSMMTWAIDRELIGQSTLPRRRSASAPRSRLISDPEIRQLWHAADQLGPIGCAFSRFVLLSFCRSGAACRIRKEWVDGSVIRIPGDTIGVKRGSTRKDEAHAITLSTWALEQLQPAMDAPGPMLFPGVNPSNLLVSLRRHAEIEDVTWHDVRRSARSYFAANGVGRDASEAALGHTVHRTQLDSVYNQHAYLQEAAHAFRVWQAHVQTLVEPGAVAGNVVRLGRAAE